MAARPIVETGRGTIHNTVRCDPVFNARATARDLCIATIAWNKGSSHMHSIIYIVGLIVVVLAILSFIGLA